MKWLDDGLVLGMGAVAALVVASAVAPKGSRAWITREGKLGGAGYLSKPQAARRQILDVCVMEYGYRSCLGSIMALERNRQISRKYGTQLTGDHRYLVRTYGGKR